MAVNLRNLVVLALSGLLMSCSSSFRFAQGPQSQSSSTYRTSKTRITFLSPMVVRLEYSATGKFIDARTLFAQNREPFEGEVTWSEENGRQVFETSQMKLVLKSDDQPFSPDNLEIRFLDGQGANHKWVPGQKDKKNLGGTVESLDQYNGLIGPVPVEDGLLSREGWHLVDDSGKPVFNSEGWIQTRDPMNNTDLYFFAYGSDYSGALAALTHVSGPVPIPRKYTFGSWYSRYWDYTQDDFKNIVKEYAQNDFPLDIMVIDTDWHLRNWTGYTWNKKLIPDGPELIRWMHDQNIAVTLNDHPSWGFAACEEHYLAFMQELDATPDTCDGNYDEASSLWYEPDNQKYMRAFSKYAHGPRNAEGVDFWWLDWQQWQYTDRNSTRYKLDGSFDESQLPEDVKERAVKNLEIMPWLNHYYFNQSEAGGKRGISFSRWGGLGDHKHPIQFSGDTYTNFETLKHQVAFTAQSSNVGAFFWSHDTGGHQGERNEESFVRWTQFTSMSASLRVHSSKDSQMDRRPWKYSPEAERAMRKVFHLRSEFIPYIYTQASKAHFYSMPLIRPMYYNYPQKEKAYEQPQQYMLGDDMIIAPITEKRVGGFATQKVWLPQGEWYDLFTGERAIADNSSWVTRWGSSSVEYLGTENFANSEGREITLRKDIDTFPVFVRAGVVIPTQPYTQRMTQTPLDNLVLRIFEPSQDVDGNSYLYEDDGITNQYADGHYAKTQFSYQKRGLVSRITISPPKGRFEGSLEKRNFVVELKSPRSFEKVLVNGNEFSIQYDSDKKIHFVSIENVLRNREIVVEFWARN